MDDKHLDEVMHGYVESTRMDKDVAFKKFNERNKQSVKTKRLGMKAAWIAAVVSLVVVLSIAVPTGILYSSSGDSEDIYYCSDSDVAYDYLGDNLSVVYDYGFDIKMPVMECEENDILATISRKNEMVIGMQISLLFDMEILNYIVISPVKKGYIFDKYKDYPKFVDSTQWEGKDVLYRREQLTSYSSALRMYFREGDYDYYIDVVGYVDFEVEDILNQIFIG